MIETIKDLLDIDTDLKDNILNHYLDKSQLAINNTAISTKYRNIKSCCS